MHYILLFILLVCSLYLNAQKSVSGVVLDANSGEELIGVSISPASSEIGTLSDNFGYFSILVPDGIDTLFLNHVGFKTVLIDLNNHQNFYTVKLSQGITIEEVFVSEIAHKDQSLRNIGIIRKSVEELSEISTLIGEADIIKSLTFLPGISSGIEGSTGLNVRGGSPDQNLILLDDAKIYNGTHLFGLLSSFNSDIISKIETYKGDIPAKYGGRLSSAIDLRVRNGNKIEKEASITLSPIVSKVFYTAPIVKDRTSILIASRVSPLSLLTLPNYIRFKNGNSDSHTSFFLYDVNAKIHHKISDKEHLSFSLSHTNDIFNDLVGENGDNGERIESRFSINYGNTALNLKYVKFINSNIIFNSSLVYSAYRSNLEALGVDDINLFSNSDVSSSIQSAAYKMELVDENDRFISSVGIEIEKEWFEPTILSQFDVNQRVSSTTDLWKNPRSPTSLALYGTSSIRLGANTTVSAGLRLWRYAITDFQSIHVEPRISISHSSSSSAGLKLNYSRTNQGVHFLSTNGITLPTDFWLPSIGEIPLSTSDQISLGYSRSLDDNQSITVEGYFKLTDNLVAQEEGVDFFDASESIQDKIVVNGRGRAYGLELLYELNRNRFSGWLSYTLSRSLRQFDEVNQGREFPYRFDRIHDLSLTSSYDINKRWSLGLNYVYTTGIAVTRPSSILVLNPNNVIPNIQSRNGSRLSAYQRMDISVSRKIKKSKLTFSIYNTLGNRNPLYERILVGGNVTDSIGAPISGMSQLRVERVSLFPFLPSISYKIDL